MSIYSNKLTALDVSGYSDLNYLACSQNQLTSLDVSGHTALGILLCQENQLTNLDFSNCTALTYIRCQNNPLIHLYGAGCSALTELYCSEMQLATLDVSGCTDLLVLSCNDNQLTSLNISTNTALLNLQVGSMETLYEVCLWTMPFPPALVSIFKLGSSNVYFTTDCSATALKPDKVTNRINIYPNPAKEYIVFDLTNISSSAIVELYDLQGKKVLEQKLTENRQVSVSNLHKGLYMYKLNNRGIIYKGKLIIE